MKWLPKGPQSIMRDFVMETPRCNLWADMGTGKTSVVYTAFDILWMAGSQFRPLLALAPKRVARDTWAAEVKKWDHLTGIETSPILGSQKQREAALGRDAQVYTINYENIPWLVDYWGKRWPYKAIVADESRQLGNFRISHGGKRAAALSKIAKMTGRWINLTGTPAPEGLQDLWGQNWFVDFGHRLGHSYTAFEERWFRKLEHGLEAYPHSMGEIMGLLSDVTLSIRARDWFDEYEEPVLRPVYVELPSSARRVYNEMERELFSEIDQYVDVEAMTQGSKYGKCSQIASGAVYTDDEKNWSILHDAKIAALKEIHAELCHDPLLVVYQFKHDLWRLQKAFPYGRLYDTRQDEDDWNEGRIPMMFVHPRSAGHGLNFQDGGCNVAFFSQIPSLELRLQVIERLGPLRQLMAGHPRPVNVWDILARDTVNELDYARAHNKAGVQDAIRAYRDRKRT